MICFTKSLTCLSPFGPSALKRVAGLENYFHPFKFDGLPLFFILMSDRACHLVCQPANIQYSTLRSILFPTLLVYAQSLLDGLKAVDFKDLIDGMNSTQEWGEENLDLESTVDALEADILFGGKATEDDVP